MAFGSIDAIFAVDAFDGDAIVPVFTFDGDTILAVNADTRFTILAVDANMAILAVFAANAQLIAQFQVIRLLPIVVADTGFLVFTA